MMNRTIPGPAYRVRTSRLLLRCWEPADAPLLKEAVESSVEHLRPWLPWAHSEPEELQTKVDRLRQFRGLFDMGQDFIYGIFDPEERRVIGGTGLHTRIGPTGREIGYWVRHDQTNRGYATEVAAALSKVAFEIDGMNRVEIHCDPENVWSAAVPARLGFTLEATLRQRARDHAGNLRDAMIWTLLAEDYPASPVAAAEIEAFDAMGRPII